MFFSYVNFQRYKSINVYWRMFSESVFEAVQKTRRTCFIRSKTTRLRLVVFNPLNYSCLSFFPWCDVFIYKYWDLLHDRHISKFGIHLRVTARNREISTTWCDIQFMLETIYFFFSYFFIHHLADGKTSLFKEKIINTLKKLNL